MNGVTLNENNQIQSAKVVILYFPVAFDREDDDVKEFADQFERYFFKFWPSKDGELGMDFSCYQ